MKIQMMWVALAVFLPATMVAQPQIGGGQCSSSTLAGNYSVTLSGRQLGQRNGSSGAGVAYSNVVQAIGYANFDGISKIVLTVNANNNSGSGTAQTWSGTYTLPANCVGSATFTSGDTGTFTLGSYDGGVDYFLEGYDGTYSYTGSGNTIPASCTTSLLAGTYAFNGNGFVLSSGAIGTVTEISGLITFDGVSVVNTNWYVSLAGGTANDMASGTYSVNANCTASGTVTDAAGNKYSLQFVVTDAKGTNFLIESSNSAAMFVGSGRTL